MNITLITPWKNVWVDMFHAEVERRGHHFSWWAIPHWRAHEANKPDLVLHGWATEEHGGPAYPGARNICFLRRFELFGGFSKLPFDKLDGIICCNTWIEGVAKKILKKLEADVPVHTVYNAVDTSKWTLVKRGPPSRKIGMACFVHPKKNLPLALQILAKLPEGYELHVAGDIQDPCTAEYLNNTAKALRRKIYLYGQLPHEELDAWWSQFDVCLSTSISEGNPNNVLEAMAKGIRPVVHAWPGAEDQFPGSCLFSTVEGARHAIMEHEKEPSTWRDYVADRYSLRNIGLALDLAMEGM
jgi:glycosyltransferase involved in cell wall biosynthesis